MTEPATEPLTDYAITLLIHYGFELGGYKALELVQKWLQSYEPNWVRLAIVEALYQGRYKAVSVEQILAFWSRRRRSLYHFNHEFERLVCRRLPQNLAATSLEEPVEAIADQHIEDSVASAPKASLYPLAPVFSYISTSNPISNNQGASADPEFTEEMLTDDEQLDSENSRTLTTQQHSIVEANLVTNGINADANFNEDFSSLEGLTTINNESAISTQVEPETVQTNEDDSAYTAKYDADWSRVEASKHPIHQFTPPPDGSDFYQKLKAVAQPNSETN